MRIPFLAGRGSGSEDDPERRKLLVAEGRVPRPFPGPWTLRALVRGDAPGEAVNPERENAQEEAAGASSEGEDSQAPR
jgi:hypothetical protein